jgi:hypothetical protein
MARGWLGLLILAAAVAPAAGQGVRPVDLGPAPANDSGGLLLSPVMTKPGGAAGNYDPPPVRPEPIRSEPIRPEPIRSEPIRPVSNTEIRPVAFDPPAPAPSGRAATLVPRTDAGAIPADRLDPPAKPAPANPLDLFPPKPRDTDVPARSKSFGGKFLDALGSGSAWLCSDHEFDYFISPVTNPFLFEDPRALTEIRPVLIYQKIPSDQPLLQGGSAWFFGTQARLSFTDRLSITMNKIGMQSFNPASSSPLDSQYGLSELWLGPKYTFVRNPETHTLLAAGAIFQIPLGSDKVYQDTGNLSIVPYVSYAQSLLNTKLGCLNFMANTGYAISTNNQRSDYYYASAHFDFDLGNAHRYYPLVEFNYFVYTTDGQARPPFGAEGRDLANIGSNSKGSNLMTWAFGGRVKVSESAQIGAAFELPMFGNRDLFQYRFTLDFIIRF